MKMFELFPLVSLLRVLTILKFRVITDIRNGINAGKTVTVHERAIKFNSWSGTGYTILDPNTGAGAYMIGGGLDGGSISFGQALYGLTFLMAGVALLTASLSLIPLLVISGGPAGILAAGAGILSGFTLIMKGLATLSPSFAGGICRSFAANAVFGTVGLSISGGIIGGTIASWINAIGTLLLTFATLVTGIQRFVTDRVCGEI